VETVEAGCMFGRVRARSAPCRVENRTLTSLSHLALILVYTCVLVLKTCEQSSDACRSYGYGRLQQKVGAPAATSIPVCQGLRHRLLSQSPPPRLVVLKAGFFLFFIFFAFSMIVSQLVFEVLYIGYYIHS
jgi:hypothetical protein